MMAYDRRRSPDDSVWQRVLSGLCVLPVLFRLRGGEMMRLWRFLRLLIILSIVTTITKYAFTSKFNNSLPRKDLLEVYTTEDPKYTGKYPVPAVNKIDYLNSDDDEDLELMIHLTEREKAGLAKDVEKEISMLSAKPHPEVEEAEFNLGANRELVTELRQAREEMKKVERIRPPRKEYTLDEIERRRVVKLKYSGLKRLAKYGPEGGPYLDIGYDSKLRRDASNIEVSTKAVVTKPATAQLQKQPLSSSEKSSVTTPCNVVFAGGQTIPFMSSPDMPRALSCEQYSEAKRLLKVVDDFIRDFNLTSVMAYGTLLGSTTSHDLIPWDDDLDIAMPRPDFLKLLKICQDKDILKKYNLAYTHNNRNQEKLFFKDKSHISGTNWSWPFIDLLWFDENITHVWIHDPLIPINVTILRNRFYPIVQRPIANLQLGSPFDAIAMLNSTYGKSSNHMTCKGTLQSHMSGTGSGQTLTVPCEKLKYYYPFVYRNSSGTDGIVVESLTLGKTELYSVNVRGQYYEQFNPFVWKWG